MVLLEKVDFKYLERQVILMRKNKQTGNWNGTNFRLFFRRNKFWHTGIQSSRFRKWPWMLNWNKWLVDIPTQILLTITGYIDYSSRCKLDVYVIAHTKEKPCKTNWYLCKMCKAMKVKRVSKIWLGMSITNINYSNLKRQVTSNRNSYQRETA